MTARFVLRAATALATLGFSGAAMAQPVVETPAAQPAAKAPLPAPDPARLALAQQIAVKIFPPGSFRTMLGENYDAMMGAIVDSVGTLPVAEIARIGGITEEQVTALGDAKMGEVMSIVDPAWRERFRLSADMTGSMVDLFDRFEPRMRDAMARSFARDFTVEQMTDILRFLDTPTGTAFGRKTMTVFTERDVAEEIAGLMPEMMKELPAAMAAQQAKIDALPERRRIEELSDEDRQRLADLLGIDVADLNDPELVPIP